MLPRDSREGGAPTASFTVNDGKSLVNGRWACLTTRPRQGWSWHENLDEQLINGETKGTAFSTVVRFQL